MIRKRREVLVALAAAAFAGCAGTGGESEGGGDGDGTETDGTTEASAGADAETEADAPDGESTAAGGSPAVRVAAHSELGDVLVDADGRTLYMFDQDTRGEAASTCYDSCADSWPPLTVSGSPTAGPDVAAELGTFARESGEEQVTAAGWPLYYFAGDGEAGEANGQGVNDVWWVLAPDGDPKRADATTDGSAGGTETDEPAGGTATETTTDAAGGPY